MNRAYPHTYRDLEPSSATCRECGKSLDTATNIKEDAPPQAGCLSLCAYCGTIGVFEDDRLVREPTEAEMAEFRSHEQWPQIEALSRMLVTRAAIRTQHERASREVQVQLLPPARILEGRRN